MDKVEAFLSKRYRDPDTARYLVERWNLFSSSRLGDRHFEKEILSGDEAKVCQRLWEMRLGVHLIELGYDVSSAESGPDFSIVHGLTKIYIEAISPTPSQVNADWVAPSGGSFVVVVPYDQLLLRWTGALNEKKKKLAKWQEKEIVTVDDVYVIAINGGELGYCDQETGSSGYPFAVEAAFPVGPAEPVLTDDGQVVMAQGSPRYFLFNHNDKRVPNFMHPEYSDVSAIIACHQRCDDPRPLPLTLVHNPKARNPLPDHVLGAQKEYRSVVKRTTRTTTTYELQLIS